MYVTVVQILLQEAGTYWPNLSQPLPFVPLEKKTSVIDFSHSDSVVPPSELLDGPVPISVPGADKPLTLSTAQSQLRAAVQSSYFLLPVSQSDILPPEVAPLFTAYYGTIPCVAPKRHHPAHQHALYYAASWSTWECQLCTQSITKQVRSVCT